MGIVERIPIGDFPLGPEEREALQRVIDSGRISEHREVRAFEDEFAAYVGSKHCVAVSSGTAALMVGLRALALSDKYPTITPGAMVLVPALTFIATANAVELAGMHAIFGDIDPHTMCLDPAEISKTLADVILPVHLMGYGADIASIRSEISEQTQPCILVEDAAEAHGTTIEGQKVGTFGVWGAFSFYIAHTVQAGELGCIVTDDAEIARIARQIKAHGRACTCRRCTRSTTGCPQIERGDTDPRFRAQYIGWNFKPMEFQAALARVQLGHIEENIERRRENRDHLDVRLASLILDGVVEPFFLYPDSVPMAFPIILKRSGIRDQVVARLEGRGVEARPLFGCIPTQQPAYACELADVYHDLVPVADRYGANGFYVGCHQYLTVEQVDRMAETIRDVIAEVVT